jgi:cytochrome c553
MVDNETEHSFATLTRGAGKMLAYVVVVLSLVLWGSARPASAIAAEAADILHYCASCHGPSGRSASPMFPHLAGQQKDYIVAQLENFRNNTRTAPHAQTYLNYLVMWGLVTQLNGPTTDAIAAFYNSQPPVAGEPAVSPEISAGRRLYAEGVPSEGVPACITCHGPMAQGYGAIPRLAGQYQDYLAHQLEVFAEWTRQNVAMHTVSINLTPEQINEVTAYLATL